MASCTTRGPPSGYRGSSRLHNRLTGTGDPPSRAATEAVAGQATAEPAHVRKFPRKGFAYSEARAAATSPCDQARLAAWVRFGTPIFIKIRLTWTFAVWVLMNSRDASCALVKPSARRVSTSRSRAVSPYRSAEADAAG